MRGVLCTALITAVCAAIDFWLPAHGVSMFYILAVVGSAVAFGMNSGLSAAISSFLAYNYFFIEPTYTFTISDPRDLFTLLIFFAVAIATGSLAGRLREAAEQAHERSQSLETLNSLATRLSGAHSAHEVTGALRLEASRMSGQPVVILSAADDGLKAASAAPDSSALNSADWQAAQRCAASRQTIYPATSGWEGSHYEFRPIVVENRVAAIVGVRQSRFDEANDAAIDAMVQQTSAALERLSLENARAGAEKRAENERLRSALLSSVSHDLKTPLAAIQGAVTSLRELGSKLPDDSKSEMLATIDEETLHLSRFVTNMLDMVRLQSGPVELGKGWIDLADTLASAVRHARKIIPGAAVKLDIRAAPALVRGDESLLEHVFLNVLENAANASLQGEDIKVILHASGDAEYRVEVEDSGTGIAAGALPKIFDKFYRAPDTKTRGSGLGLAICKEVVTAMGGSIAAESPLTNGRGTRITLTFASAASHRHGGSVP